MHRRFQVDLDGMVGIAGKVKIYANSCGGKNFENSGLPGDTYTCIYTY